MNNEMNEFLDIIPNRKVALAIKNLMKEIREKVGEIPDPVIYYDELEGYGWTMTFQKPLKAILYIEFPNQDWEYFWWGYDMKETSPGIYGAGDNQTEGKGKFHLEEALASWMKILLDE